MAKLTIVANIYAKADKVALVKRELLKLIDPPPEKKLVVSITTCIKIIKTQRTFYFSKTGKVESRGNNI